MEMFDQLIGQFEFYLGQSLLFAYVAAYLAGVLVSFTPCIYPVIPITAAVIGGQRDISGARGFVLSLFFVLGLALTYTALGVFAALTGKLFGMIQTRPLTQGVLGGLFILMGLAMLDVFQLSLERYAPRGLTGGNRKGIFGSFMIGVTSGFILGPCTAPVLAERVLRRIAALRVLARCRLAARPRRHVRGDPCQPSEIGCVDDRRKEAVRDRDACRRRLFSVQCLHRINERF
jgi:thiol:disulfide interchange protein